MKNVRVFNVEIGDRYSDHYALNFDFIVSGLFKPAVGKTFILTLAVGISFGFSFAYILMATTRSMEEFPFFLSRYVIDGHWYLSRNCSYAREFLYRCTGRNYYNFYK